MTTPSTPPPNPHFLAVRDWAEAAENLDFTPRPPRDTAGHELESIRLHVVDHKHRDVPRRDRSLEAHYGAFVISQQLAPTAAEARRRALERPYGAQPTAITVAGHEARRYELGPEPAPDDIDGRSPAVVTWADGPLFHLIASGELEADELIRLAGSLYA